MTNRLIINTVTFRLIILLLGGGVSFNGYSEGNNAVQLLNEMHTALHKLQYQGNLVYIKDGQVSNLLVKHILVNGKEVEVITAIDLGGDNYRKEMSRFSFNTIPKITPALQQVYSFDLGRISKVAGRDCRVVLARPKDRKRYLQKYCIDVERKVVLKYTLINQQHKTVEQFMFTQFSLLAPEQQPSIKQNLVKALIAKAKSRSAFVATDSYKKKEWRFESLPKGFRLISNGVVKNDKFNRKSRQLIISDGMSSISVFISKGGGKKRKPVHSGALNIVSHTLFSHEIVLVGEVPKATLEDIFKGLRKEE